MVVVLLGGGVRDDVGDRLGDADDLVCLRVWDLDGELVLDGHHHLYGIEGVELQVVLEHRRLRDLRRVHLAGQFEFGAVRPRPSKRTSRRTTVGTR